jgi:transcription elongation factor Elf1
MKARTIQMTRICKHCGLAITYRKKEKLEEADRNNEYLHDICRRAKKVENKN